MAAAGDDPKQPLLDPIVIASKAKAPWAKRKLSAEALKRIKAKPSQSKIARVEALRRRIPF